jgi:hypothetical protein
VGQQARLRETRRRLEKERRRRNTELACDAGWQEIASRFWDEECAQIRDRDAHAQRGRLADDGWTHVERNNDGIGTWDHRGRRLRIIHSVCREEDGQVWGHVSVSRASGLMPGWETVRDAGWLLYPDLFGVIVVPARASHVSINEVGHVWYCLTAPAVPDFSHGLGTI